MVYFKILYELKSSANTSIPPQHHRIWIAGVVKAPDMLTSSMSGRKTEEEV
jgi:hypothetical protein